MITWTGLCGQTESERAAALVERLAHDESGQDLIEYALVAALVGLAAISSLKGFATKLSAMITYIGVSLTGAY